MPSTALDREETDNAADATFDSVTRTREELDKHRALQEPGLPWREWVLYRAVPWWLGIALLIPDASIVVTWIELDNVIGLVLSLGAALYLEFLLYRYLWYRPDPYGKRRRGPFRPSWTRPVEFGRWTPEGEAQRRGERPGATGNTPHPDEFL
jgi:hypothetical protein